MEVDKVSKPIGRVTDEEKTVKGLYKTEELTKTGITLTPIAIIPEEILVHNNINRASFHHTVDALEVDVVPLD